MQKRLPILLLCWLLSVGVFAQKVDSMAASMMERHDYFALSELFAAHKRQLSKPVRRHVKQQLRLAFNRDKQVRRQRLRDMRSEGSVGDVPIMVDSVGNGVAVMVPVATNGGAALALFDTGATVNVVTETVARQLGLRPMGGRAVFYGEAAQGVYTFTLMADTLRVGGMTLYNVPFQQVDIPVMEHQQLIIGTPVIEMLGSVEIDLRQQRLRPWSSAEAKRLPSNLCYALPDRSLLLRVFHEGDTLLLSPDTGTTDTTLGAEYQHYATTADTVQEAIYRGVGGDVSVTEYLLSNFHLRVGSVDFVLPSVAVTSHPRFESRVGTDFFARRNRVQIDLRRMVMRVF